MDDSQIDFPSRLSARAVTAGVFSTFALMILFMSLAGGLGLWRFDLFELPQLGTGFWILAFAGWIVSIFASSYIASVVGRAKSPWQGALYGFITWSVACVLGCLLLAIAAGKIFGGILSGETTPAMLWGMFIGDVLAIGAAVLGGIQGAYCEAKYVLTERKKTK